MKRSHLVIAVAFAISILMTSAVAQSGNIRANVPFGFTIAKQAFAAGEYNVAVQGTVLHLVRLDGAGSAYLPYCLSADAKDSSPRLIFHRYGSHTFLAEVWIDGAGHELFTSARELELAGTGKQEQVVVVASASTN